MSNHTPGPWGTDDGAEVWPMDGPTSFVTLARVVGPWSDSQWYGSVEEGRANGRLIAAAPELLDALRDCCGRLRQWIESEDEDDMEALARARALIKKIEGRT